MKLHDHLFVRTIQYISCTHQPSQQPQQPCKISSLKGEVLSIISGAVESCLGSGADRILFDALVEAALASEDLGRMVGFGLGSRMRNFSGLGDDDVDQK